MSVKHLFYFTNIKRLYKTENNEHYQVNLSCIKILIIIIYTTKDNFFFNEIKNEIY